MSNWTFRLKNAGNGFIVSDGEHDICDVYMTNDPQIAMDRANRIASLPMLEQHCKSWQKDFDSLAVKLDKSERENQALRQFHMKNCLGMPDCLTCAYIERTNAS